ncbi:type II secretion system F family protein [Inconstantimicrobium mannanitabidum]|uniref:Uncharacterized protein n=1 Tax=Inconstantimicrobium mannanitabidum TaxID=1604901 RepID=A0ACB5RE86_9CLOT|nr:pilus assembly protein TadB [Clostridium sp. TW13]GKX67430.1 hypothetical protein rsdtw13_26880 [Clostridium sp. TW13]
MNFMLIMVVMGVIVAATIVAIVLIIVNSRKDYEEIDDGAVGENTVAVKRKTITKIKKDAEQAVNKEGLINYNCYEMTLIEKVKWSLIAMGVVFICSYIFYNSVIWAGIVSLIGIGYYKIKKKNIISKRKQKLLLQFKEALYIISSSLSAGKSVENAFVDAYDDLKTIFDFGKEDYILQELTYINRRIKINQTIEEALDDFATRSGLEDVVTFSSVFGACKSTGGNLKSVTEITSNIIGEKISIKQDIETLISGKKFESNILTIIPFAIVLFIRISSPDFLEPLYTIQGRLISTGALVIILISTLWGRKITNIEV